MIVVREMLPFRKIVCLSVLCVLFAVPVRSQGAAEWTLIYTGAENSALGAARGDAENSGRGAARGDAENSGRGGVSAEPWPAGVVTPDVPGERWRNDLEVWLHAGGWFSAEIDSLDRGERTVFVARGPAARVAGVSVIGGAERGVAEARVAEARGAEVGGWLAPGDTLTAQALDREMDAILQQMTREGRLAARVWVSALEPDSNGIHVTISVEPGPRATIDGVDFEGDDRTKPAYRARIAGIMPGEGAAGLDLEQARRRTAAAPSVRRVGTPRYVLTSDSTARLVIPVDMAPPGQFDLTVGWLPGSAGGGGQRGGQSAGSRGQLVGGGRLNLLNAFGAGRAIDVELDRRPSQVSLAYISVSDPMAAGLPFGLDASFSGIQQDSTFADRQWSGAVRYHLDDRLSLGVRLTRDVTRPGQAGLRVEDGRQRIPRAEALFMGVEVDFRRVDSEWQPTRGILFNSLYERGDRTTQALGTTLTSAVERMEMTLRGYLPTTASTVLALGLDVRGVRGERGGVLDESQLIRFGGARSLRGYDEDRFLVRSALRTLVEWRFLIGSGSDPSQRVFAFADMGWVDGGTGRTGAGRTGTGTTGAGRTGTKGWYPGFGFGAQVETGAGVLDLSYAMNPEESLVNGRIHIGLSFGL